MLTAASLCFGKTAHPQSFGSKRSASALPPSQGDRYYSAYSIYNTYNHYPSYPFYRFFPYFPYFPCYRRAFQAIAFPITLWGRSLSVSLGWRNKKSRAKCLTPDYSFQADAFPFLFEAEAFPFLIGLTQQKIESQVIWLPIILFRQKPFQLSLSGWRLSDYLWGWRLSDLFRLNACIKKLSV